MVHANSEMAANPSTENFQNQFVDSLVSKLVIEDDTATSKSSRYRNLFDDADMKSKYLNQWPLLANGNGPSTTNNTNAVYGIQTKDLQATGSTSTHNTEMINRSTFSNNMTGNVTFVANGNMRKSNKNGKIPYTVKYPSGPSLLHPHHDTMGKSFGAVGDVDSFLCLPQMTKCSDTAMTTRGEKVRGLTTPNDLHVECQTDTTKSTINNAPRPIVGARNLKNSLNMPNEFALQNVIHKDYKGPISPTFSVSSSGMSDLSNADSGIGSLSQSPPFEIEQPVSSHQEADEIMKYLGSLSMDEALSKISYFLNTQNIDTHKLGKIAKCSVSSGIKNEEPPTSKMSLNGYGTSTGHSEYSPQLQQGNAPKSLNMSRKAFDYSNLPPPEYLRNMPPPNAMPVDLNYKIQPDNIQFKQNPNNLIVGQPLTGTKYRGNHKYVEQMIPQNRNCQQTPYIQGYKENPNGCYSQPFNRRQAVHHNLSGPDDYNKWQSSLNPESGAPHKLYLQVEKCFEQFKMLQTERRRTEYEIARLYPNEKVGPFRHVAFPDIAESNSMIDCLVAENYREHAVIISTCRKMELMDSSKLCNDGIKAVLSIWLAAVDKLKIARQQQVDVEKEAQNSQVMSFLDQSLRCGVDQQSEENKKYNSLNDFVYNAEIANGMVLSLSKGVYELTTVMQKLRSALWMWSEKLPKGKINSKLPYGRQMGQSQ